MPAERPGFDVLVAVAIGGVIGATARYALAQAITTPDHGFPVATFLTNIVGSLMLGMVVAAGAARVTTGRHLRPFVAVGVIGSFTTFSTFAIENVVLVDRGDLPVAVLYVVATLVAGLGAARIGIGVARHFDRSATPE